MVSRYFSLDEGEGERSLVAMLGPRWVLCWLVARSRCNDFTFVGPEGWQGTWWAEGGDKLGSLWFSVFW
jgi:hypothetical protein